MIDIQDSQPTATGKQGQAAMLQVVVRFGVTDPNVRPIRVVEHWLNDSLVHRWPTVGKHPVGGGQPGHLERASQPCGPSHYWTGTRCVACRSASSVRVISGRGCSTLYMVELTASGRPLFRILPSRRRSLGGAAGRFRLAQEVQRDVLLRQCQGETRLDRVARCPGAEKFSQGIGGQKLLLKSSRFRARFSSKLLVAFPVGVQSRSPCVG